ASVKPAAVKYALEDQPGANNKCPEEGHLVALVIAPNIDFHWYRKGRNGYWSHKPGSTQVTNVDNSGHLISDPRTANRGMYTDFCSFMVVKHGHMKINRACPVHRGRSGPFPAPRSNLAHISAVIRRYATAVEV